MTLKKVIAEVEREILAEANRTVKTSIARGFKEAQKMSDGPLSPADKVRMDYPYAKRHGSPLVSLLPINQVTGEFYQDWGQSVPTRKADQPTGRLYNFNEKADFLKGGTPTAFARPIEPYLMDFVANVAERELNFGLTKIARRFK